MRLNTSGWGRGALFAGLCTVLGGCAVTTPVLDSAAREKLASETRQRMFEGQEEMAAPLTLAEATARAIKYQGEHRQKRMEEAAAAAQMDVAKWDLLPKLMLNAGYSWRNNDAFGFGFTPDGTIATNPSASQERTHTTSSIGLAWNLLDFGVSYFKARQLSDQKLIAEERRRKAVQTLMHDVRVAWWRAEAAERLLPAADRLLGEIEQAIDKTRHIEARKLLPPVQVATLRRALLDLNQQIAFRRQDLAQARIELASLINSAPGEELHVAAPQGAREVLDLTADLDKLEVLALQSRPELAEEGYRARISADEARKSLIALLPNLSFDLSRNHDTNKFLLNSTWTSAGVNVAFNLVKAFSLPALNRSEKAQRSADEARRQAIAMAVLTQTRIAAIRYTLVADEYLVWDEASRDDDLIVQYLASSEKVGIDTELELIRARARAMASQINRDLAYANLQASVARLFNSVGYDAVPREDEAKAVAELAGQVESRYETLERASFTQRAAAKKLVLTAGAVSGAEPKVAALLREGLERVIDGAGMKAGAGATPDARLDINVVIEAARQGRQPAHITINAVSPAGVTLTREFNTTLSLPVDAEQWRVLGEGAAYRVIADISPVRITRPSLRTAQSLQIPPRGQQAEGRNVFPGRDVEPLGLRLEPVLGAVADDLASVGASR
jgi:outer membrane protein TolC